jgi:Holliday junction DNA helicase RuvA
MYEYIVGKITVVTPYYVVLENNDIGYQVLVGNPYSFSKYMNTDVKVYIYQAIREDAHTLYGFHDIDEKNLFLKLISVNGIGPKSGLAIMAGDDSAGLIQAIATEDVGYLTKFPGVGKKTASQMVLDLKGKLGGLETLPEVAAKITDAPAPTGTYALDEAIEAMEALGYAGAVIKRVEKELAKTPGLETDEYLRMALKLVIKK